MCSAIKHDSSRLGLQPHTSFMSFSQTQPQSCQSRKRKENKSVSVPISSVLVSVAFSYVFIIVFIHYLDTHIIYHNVTKFINLLPWKHRGRLSASLLTQWYYRHVCVSVCVCVLDTVLELWVCSLHVLCCLSAVSLPRY